MKLLPLGLLLSINTFAIQQNPAKVSPYLLDAIEMVESGGDTKAVGDGGQAVGCLQIHPITVRDANRICGSERFCYNDRYSRVKSRQMAEIVLGEYGAKYEHETGRMASYEVLARIWNGGWYGLSRNKGATDHYWSKVEEELLGAMR